MKRLKVKKKTFNDVESFRANCSCVCKCRCGIGKPNQTVDMNTHTNVYSKFFERGAGMY